MSSQENSLPPDENSITGEEAEHHRVYIKRADRGQTEEERQGAFAEGFLTFGLRFTLGLGYLAAKANNEGPMQELMLESQSVLKKLLDAKNQLTDRADEDACRAGIALEIIQNKIEGLERLAAKCLLKLREGQQPPLYDLAREALLRALRRSQINGEFDEQLLLIEVLLDNRFEVEERSLELIAQGQELLAQVTEAWIRHDFSIGVVGYYVARAMEEQDQDNATAKRQWAEKADEILRQMRDTDPDFLVSGEDMNVYGMVMELLNKPAEALATFARSVDSAAPQDKSYQMAAQIEARYRMKLGKYQRVCKILSPIVSILEKNYLTAVEDSAIAEAGQTFSECVWDLAFAHAHLGQWEDAIKYIERGKSLRLRYQTALRQSAASKRLTELETKLYMLSRGVSFEADEFQKKKVEKWLSDKISLKYQLLEEYRKQRASLTEKIATPSISEIATALGDDEAVVIFGVTNRGGTLVAVICRGDDKQPSGRILHKNWTWRRWMPPFAGKNQDGWLFALGAPERKLNHRSALTQLLAFVEKAIGKDLGLLLQEKPVRRITIIPHVWFHLVPFWALPSLEAYEVSMAASAAHFIQSKASVCIETRKALVVADPTGDLPVSQAEADAVVQHLSGMHFEVIPLEEATEDRIAKALPGVSIFHFSGHGRSDTDNPIRSALFVCPDLKFFPQQGGDPFDQIMAGRGEWESVGEDKRGAVIRGRGFLTETRPEGQLSERLFDYGEHGSLLGIYRGGVLKPPLAEMWTAGDLLVQGSLSDCRLAFLSACEVGSGGMSTEVDEYSGLPAALQLAGVSTIISSLWPVSDALTALYVDLFYQALAQSLPQSNIATLTRQVSTRLREMKKEQAVSLLHDLRRRTKSPDVRFDLEAYIAGVNEGSEFPFGHPYDWASFFVTGTADVLFSEEASHGNDGKIKRTR